MMRLSALVLALAFAGCTRSADPRLYTLVPKRGTQTYPSSNTIVVRRPTVAGYLDRRDIVMGIDRDKLEVAGDANWAEPLDAMVGRVLAEDLAQRLPNSRVLTDLNTLGAVSDLRVDIEFSRFDHGEDGLVLRAMVALHRGFEAQPPWLDSVELRAKGDVRGTREFVAALDGLVAQLADRIAQVVANPPATVR